VITTLEEKIVVGRKTYSCGFCRRTIEKGERHLTQRNVDGADIWTWRAHLACYDAVPSYLDSLGIKLYEVDDYDDTIDPDDFRRFVDNATYDATKPEPDYD